MQLNKAPLVRIETPLIRKDQKKRDKEKLIL